MNFITTLFGYHVGSIINSKYIVKILKESQYIDTINSV